jgi:hypothetical protein
MCWINEAVCGPKGTVIFGRSQFLVLGDQRSDMEFGRLYLNSMCSAGVSKYFSTREPKVGSK